MKYNDSTTSLPFGEYPRPLLVRSSWTNLNGSWHYAFTKTPERPDCWDGSILVPYSPEAPLSGVNRQLKPDEYLHYERTFTLSNTDGMRTLLHFGAVDDSCRVYVNNREVGSHQGGYLPFTFDITNTLCDGENTLRQAVQDPSDTGHQARGKQKLQRGGMYYTAQSGIWQTVWLEQVPEQYVMSLQITPDLSACTVRVQAQLSDPDAWEGASVRIFCGSSEVISSQLNSSGEALLSIPRSNLHLWSPEDPFLYDVTLTLNSGDTVKSYFAMREFGTARDKNGLLRFTLNGKFILLHGLLDQGYWPEDLYTPPNDEAMITDIRTMKEMGFNLLRKHVKIEPQRWYYHCDRLGMIVWQDMPNGGGKYNAWLVTYAINVLPALLRLLPDRMYTLLARSDADARAQYYTELAEMITLLAGHPSIASWCPFNEGWGQFDAEKATALIRSLDAQNRPIDEASGWFDQGGGDMYSLHNYFYPLRVRRQKQRVAALTEYGGVAWACPGHTTTDSSYGYGAAKTKEAFCEKYRKLLLGSVLPQLKNGLSALVYTQVSDVEDEINGLFTYDRQVLKLDQKTACECAAALREEFRKVTK